MSGSTVERIRNGHAQSWVDEWSATADRLAGETTASADAGQSLSAARQFLRVSMYYSLASYAADGTGDSTLVAKLWERHRAAWDRFVDLTDLQIERIEISYEGTTLPGYFFRPGPAGGPRRTLIYSNGSDGPVTGAWVLGIADGLECGDLRRAGPERRTDPPEPDVPAGLGEGHHPGRGPPADAPGCRCRQDRAARVSEAGYWVARSVAFEHRIAAAVVDPGVIDASATMFGQVPHFLMEMIDAGEQEKFDRDMELALRFSAATRTMMAFRMRPYGTTSPYEFFTAARAYELTDEVIGQITCPVLVTDPDHEQFWPGQSRQLYDKLPAGKKLIRFTEEEGADSHCEPAANGIRGERIFNWLDRHVPA